MPSDARICPVSPHQAFLGKIDQCVKHVRLVLEVAVKKALADVHHLGNARCGDLFKRCFVEHACKVLQDFLAALSLRASMGERNFDGIRHDVLSSTVLKSRESVSLQRRLERSPGQRSVRPSGKRIKRLPHLEDLSHGRPRPALQERT